MYNIYNLFIYTIYTIFIQISFHITKSKFITRPHLRFVIFGAIKSLYAAGIPYSSILVDFDANWPAKVGVQEY